jgi:hypothetical protein
MRRLLIVPAAALVLLGGPVLATEATTPPPATTNEVAVAPAGQTVQPGWTSESTPVDANLVGVEWDGDPAAEFTVEAQHADGSWEPASPVGTDADNQPDAGTKDAASVAQDTSLASEPVWVGDDATAVRVALTSGEAANVTVAAVNADPAASPSGSAGANAGWFPAVRGSGRYLFAGALFAIAALLVALAFGWSPWRRRSLRLLVLPMLAALVLAACIPPPPSGGGSGIAEPQPAMFTRGDWGARPFSCAGGPEYASSLKFAVVHHTVNSNNYQPGDSAAMVRAIQAYHMDVNGYCDIAYHFVIDKYGQIFEGRDGGIDRPVIGGHAGGFNTGSTGVALLGDYSNVNATPAQWEALVHLLRWRLSVGGVDPSLGFWHTVGESPCNCQNWPPGTVVHFDNAIVGHRDVDQTACPGNTFYPQLGNLREQVQSGIVIPPPTTTTTTPSTTTSTSTSTTSTTSTTAPPPTTTTT